VELYTEAGNLKNLTQLLLKKYNAFLEVSSSDAISIESIINSIDKYYEDIIGCMAGNIYWFDKHCRTVGCNKNVLAMFGLQSVENFKGLSFEELGKIGGWTLEATQSFKNDTLEILQTGKPKLNIEEPPIPHEDGRVIYFLSSRVPLFNYKNDVIGVVGVSIDITERHQAEKALKKAKLEAEAASYAKTEFISNMSHDIKTPLSGIIGLADVLMHRLEQKEDIDFAENIINAGQQLMVFFDNCLEIGKAETSNLNLANEYFSLKSVTQELYDLFLPAIKKKSLEFYLFQDDKVPDYLLGSRSGIYRILMNLIGNAIKFTDTGSITLRIELGEKSTSKNTIIKIIVKDTGIGIPVDKHQLIFERFIRLTPSSNNLYSGSGLGLYLVQKMVESMHGEIHLSSAEGKGSQFTVVLPFVVPLLTSQEYKQSEITSLVSLPAFSDNIFRAKDRKTSPCILLVEDNILAQKIAYSMLTSLQCRVDIADCGQKAKELFTPGKYDLIFMDLGLPDMSGQNITRYFREIEKDTSHSIPIIVLSAHTTIDLKKSCIEHGANEVHNKPLSKIQAKSIIDYYLTKS